MTDLLHEAILHLLMINDKKEGYSEAVALDEINAMSNSELLDLLSRIDYFRED